MKSYETYTREVVPGSCKTISEDETYKLVRVLHLACPSLQSFKDAANSNKFTVREFVFNAQAIEDDEKEKLKLQEEEKAAKLQARKTLQTAFSEVFLLHLHLQAVRIFIDSALWYSLPLNFQAMAIKVNPRKEAGLQAALDKEFENAKGSAPKGDDDSGRADERQYVYLTYTMDYVE